jgi:2-polyprenyl-6-methoxyphenol hydroxylase-like FAD-dependent oxidoreductase
MDYDVVIAGAGPVGLTLAGQLTRQGVRCLVVDRAAARTDKSKALVVWPRTLELLRQAGMVEPFLAAGIAVRTGRLYGGSQPLAELDFSRSGSAFEATLMIPQSETERLLEADVTAGSATLLRSTELVRFRDEGATVRSVLRAADGGEREVTSAWLVGCDGAHSAVRHGLGLVFAGAPDTNDWFLADLHVDGPLAHDEVRIHLHPDGIMAFFPIPPDRFRLIGDLGPSRGAQPPEPSLADVQAMLDRRGPGGLTARDPVWLAGFRINERQVPTYRIGRVLLAGDAAHIHSPAGGQGMNTGMHDAFNLAWKLALVQHGRARPALIDSYQEERHRIGAMIVRGAGALTRMGTLRHPFAQRLRNMVVRHATRLRAVQHAIVGMLTETAIHYRGSAIVRDGRTQVGRGMLRAGDRVPDVALAGGTLYARLRVDRHTLLLPTAEYGASAEAAFPGVVAAVEVGDALRTALGPGNAAVVRPDGYLGYVGPPERVVEFLDTYLLRTAPPS